MPVIGIGGENGGPNLISGLSFANVNILEYLDHDRLALVGLTPDTSY
jgi:hypothetical protein